MVKVLRNGVMVKLRPSHRQAKRQEQIDRFKATYAANPCNRLPGSVLFNLYRRAKNQKQLETLAEKWLEDRDVYLKRMGIAA